MHRLAFATAALALLSTTANADFQRWSVEKDDDPFAKGERVTVGYMSSIRSGVYIFCEPDNPGLRVRAIPGFAYSAELMLASPEMSFAIDGDILLEGVSGSTGSVGDNLATAEGTMTKDDATTFLKAFGAAKKQVAIKDGISDRPHLLRASGSTKTAEALTKCLAAQQ